MIFKFKANPCVYYFCVAHNNKKTPITEGPSLRKGPWARAQIIYMVDPALTRNPKASR